MAARSLPTAPTFPANSELTSTQLTQLVTYMQFWANPPSFRAEQHTAQSPAVPNNALTQITCETVIHDSDNGLGVTTPYSYVIPFAGTWDFSGAVGFAGNATGVRIPALLQNGSGIAGAQPEYIPPASFAAFPVAAKGVPCNVGDVISIWGLQSSGGALATNTTLAVCSYFAGDLRSLQTP